VNERFIVLHSVRDTHYPSEAWVTPRDLYRSDVRASHQTGAAVCRFEVGTKLHSVVVGFSSRIITSLAISRTVGLAYINALVSGTPDRTDVRRC